MAMARKEWIQLRRDPRSMVLAFALPVALLDLLRLRHYVGHHEYPSRRSRRGRNHPQPLLVEAFEGSGYFEVVERPAGMGAVADALLRGRVAAVLVIPSGFARDLGGQARRGSAAAARRQ
jgi:ABC-2 type transport system permease protein